MAEVTAELKTEIEKIKTALETQNTNREQLEADQNALRAFFNENIGKFSEKSDFKISKALLHFYQGLLVFSSAIMGGVFIGLPHTENVYGADKNLIEVVPGYGEVALYIHVLTWLTVLILSTGVLALITQLMQEKIGGSKILSGIMIVLSLAVIGLGVIAAWPLIPS